MDCIFCKIIAGDIPTKFLFSDENVIAFEDISPKAPTHILIVPKKHNENAAQVAANDSEGLISIFKAAEALAAKYGLAGYRTIYNTGAEAGQSVFHAHLHLMGGRAFGWPPG